MSKASNKQNNNNTQDLDSLLKTIGERNKSDILFVNHDINKALFNAIIKNLHESENKKSDSLILILNTKGGSGDFAYRIAKTLQETYKNGYLQYIVSSCKSAGTLIACGARGLRFSKYHSELGPLDIQRQAVQDLEITQQSALNPFKFLEFLKEDAANFFRDTFGLVKVTLPISVKTAHEVASKIVQAIYEPIAKQIEPVALGELYRNLKIGNEYARMLTRKHNNIKDNGIKRLIEQYPDHGFIIDLDEAKEIFKDVNPIEETELSISNIDMFNDGNLQTNLVKFISYVSK